MRQPTADTANWISRFQGLMQLDQDTREQLLRKS